MKPAVVNAWSRTVLMPAGEGALNYRWKSLAIIECTRPPLEVRFDPGQTSAVAVEIEEDYGDGLPGREQDPPSEKVRTLYAMDVILEGLSCVMAPDRVLACDGVLHSFSVAPAGGCANATAVRFFLEHAVVPTVTRIPGLPYLVVFEFPRDSLKRIFASRVVVIDPGHGGRDAGFRGPVNLMEKDVVLVISKILFSLLRLAGARPHLTRRDDVLVPESLRVGYALERGAHCLVRIHTSGEREQEKRTYFVRYPRGCRPSLQLGLEIRDAVLERMGVRMRPVEWEGFEAKSFPVVQVEPLCLTNYADEANFRAPLFQTRLAQSIFNGLMRWYATGGGVRD